ncbi:MAG: ATP-binding cassette domain-containing protein, partial [Bacteroidota bacterium]
NIVFGKPNATEVEVLEATRLATAHDFVQGLPNGYHTQIGEKDFNLSGGQRQRILIARTLLGKPTLLILDEPTNHLDEVTTRQLLCNLKSLGHQPCMLLISHQKEVIEYATKTYAINNGQLKLTSHYSDAAAVNQ